MRHSASAATPARYQFKPGERVSYIVFVREGTATAFGIIDRVERCTPYVRPEDGRPIFKGRRGNLLPVDAAGNVTEWVK